MRKILISSCLLGRPVRYDGSSKRMHHRQLDIWMQEGRLVPICPEVAAGLPTPRPPSEIEGGKTADDVLEYTGHVFEQDGTDVSTEFRIGAGLALEIARTNGCQFALLKENSPSCGSNTIYSGSFNGQTRDGQGITAALLAQNGIAVFSEYEIDCLVSELANGGEKRRHPLKRKG